MQSVQRLRSALRFSQRRLAPSSTRVDGTTLALYRVACNVAAGDVARLMNVSKQYVSKLEAEGATVETAGRYRVAVDQLAADAARPVEA